MDRKSLLLFVAALAGSLSPGTTLAKFADISGNANVSYFQTESTIAGEKTSTWNLNQNYTLNLRKQLTRTISFFGNLNYTITETKEGDRNKNLFPQFILNFTPPQLYNLDFSFNRNQTLPSEGVGITTSVTTASFDLPQSRWPALSITFNRTTTEDDADPRRVDTVSNAIGFKTNYGFNLLETESEVSYSFRGSLQEDAINEIDTEDLEHFLGVNFSRKFWDDKILVNGDLAYIFTETTRESTGAPQRFETVFPPNEGLFSVGAAPLTTNAALIDRNLTSSAGIDIDDPAFQGSNIVVRYNSDQALFKINLYVNTTQTKAVIDTLNLGWQLSTSNDGITFSAPQPISPTYEEVPFKRFVFTFSERSARFFRLVNTLSQNIGLPIEVAEMEPVGFVLATPTQRLTQERSRSFGGFGLSYTPTENLKASYNVSFSNTSDELSDRETTTITQNANLGYTVIPQYLLVSTGFITTSVESTGAPTNRDYSYSLGLSSRPLLTLRTSAGVRRTEASEGGDTTSRSDSLVADVSMRLYRGLDLSLRSNLVESKDFVNDSDTSSILFSGTLRLKPWKPLTITTNGSTTRSVTDQQGVETTTTTNSLTTNISWNATRKIFVSGRLTLLPDISHSYALTWLPTRSFQTSGRVGFSEDTKNYGININWRVLRRFSTSFGYNTTMNDKTDTEIDTLFARGSVSF
jgi:hypothetical protein